MFVTSRLRDHGVSDIGRGALRRRHPTDRPRADRSRPDDERIHSIRKRCKKLRGLLRLVRPSLGDTYERENAYFRDVARALSPLRDVHVTLAAFDAVLAHSDGEVERGRFAPLRQRLMGPDGRL